MPISGASDGVVAATAALGGDSWNSAIALSVVFSADSDGLLAASAGSGESRRRFTRTCVDSFRKTQIRAKRVNDNKQNEKNKRQGCSDPRLRVLSLSHCVPFIHVTQISKRRL